MSNPTIKQHAVRMAKSDAQVQGHALIATHQYQLKALLEYEEKLIAALESNDLSRAADVLKNMLHYQSVNCSARLDLLSSAIVDLRIAEMM